MFIVKLVSKLAFKAIFIIMQEAAYRAFIKLTAISLVKQS
jgi:hypothetical protein